LPIVAAIRLPRSTRDWFSAALICGQSVGLARYCHQNDGSGGFKVSGRNGSIFTPNISPDMMAGIGGWSDDEIARAIHSGVSGNGRPHFWHDMSWDHFFQNAEDICSLIAYVREMPPVAEKVPPYSPPAADDGEEYAFWTHKTMERGCRG
jgi:hypothetical protein